MDLASILAILEGEGTNEEKSQKLYAEHESEKKPLESKNKQLLDEKKKLQEKYEEFLAKVEPEKKATEARIQELEDQIKKGGSEEAKAAFEAQLKREQEKSLAEIAKIKAELEESGKTNASLREIRRLDKVSLGVENAMTKAGVTDPKKREQLKKAFLYDYENKFKLNDDESDPIDDEYKTIEERMLSYDGLSYYLPANSTGGGATGSGGAAANKPNTMTRDRFEKLSAQEKMDYVNKGGLID